MGRIVNIGPHNDGIFNASSILISENFKWQRLTKTPERKPKIGDNKL